jgi:hypothetical protein
MLPKQSIPRTFTSGINTCYDVVPVALFILLDYLVDGVQS